MKKVLFNYLTFVILCLLVWFFSCNDNADVSNGNIYEVKNETNFNKFTDECNPANSQNSYDYVGKIHNEIVSEYVNKYSSDENISIGKICSVVDSLAASNQDFLQIKTSAYQPVDSLVIQNGVLDFENNFSHIIDSLNISQSAKDELSDLEDYLFARSLDLNEPSLSDINTHIITMETSILNDNTYTQAELKILLSATSTARFSCCFWNNYYMYRATSKQSISMAKRKWWQWLIVGAADVGGAIAGAGGTAAGAVTVGATASSAAYTMTDPSKK